MRGINFEKVVYLRQVMREQNKEVGLNSEHLGNGGSQGKYYSCLRVENYLAS